MRISDWSSDVCSSDLRSTDAVSAELPAAATLQERLDFVLQYARRGGASTAEASASASRGLNVNVRKDAIESLEFQQDRELGLTVYIGQRKGHATTGDRKSTRLNSSH